MSGMFIQLLSVCTRIFSKMKVYCSIAALGLCFAIQEACESQQWRGHQILCCSNGTAIINKGMKVWVAKRPFICAPTEKTKKSSIVIKVVGCVMLVACCGLQCYCTKWKNLLRCCAHKVNVPQNAGQPPKAEADEGNEKALEMRARRASI